MKSVEKHIGKQLFQGTIHFLVFLLCPLFGFSQDSLPTNKPSPVQFQGYIKNMQSAFFVDRMSSLVTGNLLHNRINLRWNVSDNIYIRTEVRNRLYYGEQVKMTHRFGKYMDSDNGIVDLSYNVIDDTSVVFNTMLDRALINWSSGRWDITLGRQRINWGINLVWNPNDIFNAYNYFDFDYEERPGTDALRIQYSTGKFSLLELAYKFSDRKNEQAGAIMYKTNFRKYDLQYFSGVYFKDIVIGTGWAGNIKNTGFKGEASYFHPYENVTDTTGVLSASVSFDRSFKNDYFVTASYLYNSGGNGLLYGNGISELMGPTVSVKKLIPFEHTLFFQAGKSFNPLVNGSMAFMFSPKNNTLIVLPSLAVSVSDDWDIGLIGQLLYRDSAGVYRTVGNGIYFRLRWSF